MDPVLDDPADEIGVGNDQTAAVEGLDLGRPRLDRANEHLIGSHHHQVADPDGALPQEDEAGDEIVGDCLQAETDTDRQAAGDQGEFLNIEADLRAGQERGDDDSDIAKNRPDRVSDAGVQTCLRQESRAQPVLDQPGEKHRDGEHDRGADHRRQRQRDAAERKAEIGRAQRAEHVLRLHAPRLQHRRDGDHQHHHTGDALQDDGDLRERVAAQTRHRHETRANRRIRLEEASIPSWAMISAI